MKNEVNNMDFDLLQNIKNNLSRRLNDFDEISSTFPEGYKSLFFFRLSSFYEYITSNDIISTILSEIEVSAKDTQDTKLNLEETATNIINYPTNTLPVPYWEKDEKEHAYFSYFILKTLFKEQINNHKLKLLTIAAAYEGRNLEHLDQIEPLKSYLGSFKNIFIQPLHNYILEKLDENQITISILLRYKQKCEWFQKEKEYLRDLYEENTDTGEDKLKEHLFEYFHDQGWNFTIEPNSLDGKVDFIADQRGKNCFIAEAKIFDGRTRSFSYIKKGFNQTYTYTKQHNSQVGYLVIYKVCEKDLRLDIKCQNSVVHFLHLDGKIIYILVIDIAHYRESPSVRKTLKPIIISEEQLLNTETIEQSEENQE